MSKREKLAGRSETREAMPNGRAYVPTPKDREYVRAMYGVVGLTIEQIAAVMRVTERTIRNHYRDDLSGARAGPSGIQETARVATSRRTIWPSPSS